MQQRKRRECRMESVALIAQQQLVIERGEREDTLQLFQGNGRLTLTVRITADGPVLEVAGGSVAIRASGALSINAQRVAIRARDGFDLESGGDARITAGGTLEIAAERQQVTARSGDVRVRANNDVLLDGERIRMNC